MGNAWRSDVFFIFYGIVWDVWYFLCHVSKSELFLFMKLPIHHFRLYMQYSCKV